MSYLPCSKCNGSGEVPTIFGGEKTCPKCGGSGKAEKKVSQCGVSYYDDDDDNPSLFCSGN